MKLIGCFAVVSMAAASFLLASNSNQKNRSDLAISNVEALNASAAEIWCDNTNEQECLLGPEDWLHFKQKGYLRATY